MSGLAKSLSTLFGHLAKLHMRIAIGSPAYSEMKDSFSTYMTYLFIAGLTGLPALFVSTADSDPMDWKTQLYWMSFVVGPVIFVEFIAKPLTPSKSMFPASLFGACTVVHVVSFVLWLVGVVEEPLSMATIVAEVVLWVLCLLTYRRQRPEVRARGYGLRTGEF